MEKFCAVDATPMIYSEGVSKKNGKPYKMFKCPQCQAIEWVKQNPTPQVNAVPGGNQGDNNAIVNALREIYILLDSRLPKSEVNTKDVPFN